MNENKTKFVNGVSIWVKKDMSDCEVVIISSAEINLINPKNMDIIVYSERANYVEYSYLVYDHEIGIVKINDKNMKRDTSFIKTKEEARSMYIAFKNGDWDRKKAEILNDRVCFSTDFNDLKEGISDSKPVNTGYKLTGRDGAMGIFAIQEDKDIPVDENNKNSKKDEILNDRKTINLKLDKEIKDSNLLKVIEAINNFELIDVDNFKIEDFISLSEDQRKIAQMFFEQIKQMSQYECEIQIKDREKIKNINMISDLDDRLGKFISECADKTKQIQDLKSKLEIEKDKNLSLTAINFESGEFNSLLIKLLSSNSLNQLSEIKRILGSLMQYTEEQRNIINMCFNIKNARISKNSIYTFNYDKYITNLQDELSNTRKFESVLKTLLVLNGSQNINFSRSIDRSLFTEEQNSIIDEYIKMIDTYITLIKLNIDLEESRINKDNKIIHLLNFTHDLININGLVLNDLKYENVINPLQQIGEIVLKLRKRIYELESSFLTQDMKSMHESENNLNKLNEYQEKSRIFKSKEITRLLEFAKSLKDIKGPVLFTLTFNSNIDNLKQIGDILINLRQGQEELKGDELNRIHNLSKLVEDYPKFIEKGKIEDFNKQQKNDFPPIMFCINDGGEFTHYYNEIGNKYIQLVEENQKLKEELSFSKSEILKEEMISNTYLKKIKKYEETIRDIQNTLGCNISDPNLPILISDIPVILLSLIDECRSKSLKNSDRLKNISIIEKDNEIKRLKEEVEVHKKHSTDRFKTTIRLIDELNQNKRIIHKLKADNESYKIKIETKFLDVLTFNKLSAAENKIQELEAIIRNINNLENNINRGRIFPFNNTKILNYDISSFNNAMHLINGKSYLNEMDQILSFIKNETQRHNCSLEFIKTIDLVNMFIFNPNKRINTIIKKFKRDFVMKYPSNLPNFFNNDYTNIFGKIITTINLFYFWYLVNDHRLHIFNITKVFFDCMYKQDHFLDMYHDYKDQYKPFIEI